MNRVLRTLAATALLTAMHQPGLADTLTRPGHLPDLTVCASRTACLADSLPDSRPPPVNPTVFQLGDEEARLLGTPPETYIGQGIVLSADLGSEPQPVPIPVRGGAGGVGTETVFFEYAGIQIGPRAIDVFGTANGHTQIETEHLVGELFVAVPSIHDAWSASSALQYDPRLGKAAGYILRYQMGGASHVVGTLIVASDDDDTRHAISVGSVPARWTSVLGLDPADPYKPFHFVVAAPQAHGFDNGCDGVAICDNYCSAALPWEIEQCGSACCSAGGSPTPTANQCNDGLDNDLDGTADETDGDCGHSPMCADGPSHAHRFESGFNFMLTAKTSWCSSDTDPFGELWARTGYSKQAFRAGTGNAGFDNFKLTNDNVARPVAVKCWTFSDPQDALNCDLNGNCGPFAADSAPPYPFAQISESSDLFAAAVDDLRHSATVGLDQPVSLIQVIVPSFEPTSGGSASGAAEHPGRASVVLSSAAYSTGAHELGHSVGLDHCDADLVDGQWTLMGSSQDDACQDIGSHQRDHFGPTSGNKLHDCMLNSCFVLPSF